MTQIKSMQLQLVSLPGAGQSKLKAMLADALPNLEVMETTVKDWSDIFGQADTKTAPAQNVKRLLLVDIRNQPDALFAEAQAVLQALVNSVNALCFMFNDAAALDEQAAWASWLKSTRPGLDVYRVSTLKLPQGLLEQLHLWSEETDQVMTDEKVRVAESDAKGVLTQVSGAYQTFEFKVGQVNYEHLLFGLDTSRQNLGMQIYRVKAYLNSFEYANQVWLEGTANRWDGFAAEDEVVQANADGVAQFRLGQILVSGTGLSEKHLSDLVTAAQM